MSLAHNVFIRNLNAIYLQAPNIKLPLDIRDFLIFCQTFVEAIHHHHKVEEKYFFPAIEEYTGSKGLMEVNVHQHEAFEAGLDKFTEYVGAAAPEEFDGKKLIEIIDSFGEVLMGHLNDEINTLLGLEEYGGEKLRAAWDLLEKKIQGELGFKDMVLPTRDSVGLFRAWTNIEDGTDLI
jgi:hemerythrin-like domain-containing protein